MIYYIQTIEELGQNLRLKRERCGLTQREVADKLYIDRSTYAYYEIGKTEPSVLILIRLAEIFEIPLIELFKRKHY